MLKYKNVSSSRRHLIFEEGYQVELTYPLNLFSRNLYFTLYIFKIGLVNNDFKKNCLLSFDRYLPPQSKSMNRRKKVSGIEVPPTFEEFQALPDMPFSFYSQVSAKLHGFSSKGDYLDWAEFKLRHTQFKNNFVWAWWALKFRRNLESHANLKDEKYSTFQWSESASNARIHKIERLSSLKHLNLNEDNRKHFLAKNLVMEEAITSAQLEGAATTRPIAKELLESGREPRDFSEKMIINNWKLLQFAIEHTDSPLTPELIRLFNKEATDEVCENGHTSGQFRTEPVQVSDNLSHEIVYNAPPANDIDSLTTMLCKYANSEHEGANYIHPIIKGIVLHFMIGYIHPFLDGNGRTARALFYWFVIKSGYTNFQYISISALLKNKPKQYVKAYVKTEVDDNDLTHFIDFNLKIIIQALTDFGDYINRKISETNLVIEKLSSSPFFKYLKLPHITIIKKALETSGRTFTTHEIAVEFNVSENAARQYLDRLSELELLIKYQIKGRKCGYIAPNDLSMRLKR